jgi:hypothetical protein
VNKGFESYRQLGNKFVDGWLEPEVLTILTVLNSAQRSKNISGAVAEIGVHHGRLFIGLNLLQRADEHAVAIDLFGDQDLNVDLSGKGDLAAFQRNLERWSPDHKVVIHQGDSTQLQAAELRELAHSEVRLFSVDGGHTDPIVFSDMKLAEDTLTPGGIVIADDIFNQYWPGVATGTLRYMEQGGQLVPFAIGFNKVFFATPPYAAEYRAVIERDLGNKYLIFLKTSEFASHEVVVVSRVPRRPREILSRNEKAKSLYNRLYALASRRP